MTASPVDSPTVTQLQPELRTIDGEPVEIVVIGGEEIPVVDAWQAVTLCRKPMRPATFAQYSSKGLPKGNPAPRAIATAHPSGRALYPLRAVLDWDASRPGGGGWGHKGTPRPSLRKYLPE